MSARGEGGRGGGGGGVMAGSIDRLEAARAVYVQLLKALAHLESHNCASLRLTPSVWKVLVGWAGFWGWVPQKTEGGGRETRETKRKATHSGGRMPLCEMMRG